MITLRLFTTQVLLATLIGCAGQPRDRLSEALALYYENRLDEALPLLEEIASQDDANAEHHAWLAETYRRTSQKAEAVTSARAALALDSCSAFAHTVLAEAVNPIVGEWEGAHSDTTWHHIMKAVACDSTDGNPWLIGWGEAIRRRDPLTMRRSLRRLVETGFLTRTAMAYGRWMLRALPPNAILITNGDMDTYPPGAVQEVEGFRTDVAIVNRGTLNTPWYARFVRDHAGVVLPFDDEQLQNLKAFRNSQGKLITPSDQIFRAWVDARIRGSLERPLTIAPTVDEPYYAAIRSHLRYAGAFREVTDERSAAVPDTMSMRASLQGMSPVELAGPWTSEQDRSPIRRMGTKNIVRGVTGTALSLAEALADAGRNAEAERWARWAEEVDRTSELGPVFSQRIARLKQRI
jgi:tetratricopeptide (TPR) repeat protein